MLYLIYIVLGLLIVLAVNYAVTAFLAVHDLLENRKISIKFWGCIQEILRQEQQHSD